MSDVSNPIASSDRFTFDSIVKEEVMKKRQDFQHLESLVQGGARVIAPEMSDFSVPNTQTVKRLVKVEIPVDKGPIPIPFSPLERKMPVCKYHPTGVNQEKGSVSVSRTFHPPKRNETLIRALLRYSPLSEGLITQKVMSTGTKTGFAKRLAKWYDHKIVDQPAKLKEMTGFTFHEVLNEHLPLKGKLPDWNQPIHDLLAKVKVTKSSSAGPPLYSPKVDCWTAVLAIMEDLIEAGNQDRMQEFLDSNEELILGECRNKADRYKVSELSEKCRPYWCFSSAISIFVSFLMQSFCEQLELFSTNKKSWNAYGFSLPHGGGSKIFEWMKETKEGEAKCAIYGDDVMLVKRKKGVLRVYMPDFAQMDASVSNQAILHTMSYVVRKFSQEWGDSPFWEAIATLGTIMAGTSSFVVEGSNLYTKKGGLRTGVVGTTLYDTALAIVAYKSLIHTRVDLEDEVAVKHHMLQYGLQIKGDWKGGVVNEEPTVGELICDEKWLGALFEVHQGGQYIEPIPIVREEELITLIANARITERGKMSLMAEQRTLFDMARGYMVTGGYLSNEIYSSLAHIVNNTPPTVIAMRVQENSGVGAGPELHLFAGEDFLWPTSDGFPEKNFCKDVYLSPDNLLGGKWLEIFPTLTSELKKFRSVNERVPPVMPIELSTPGGPAKSSTWFTNTQLEQAEAEVEEIREPTVPAALFDDPPLVSKIPHKPTAVGKMKPKMETETKYQHIENYTAPYDTIHGYFVEAVFPHYPATYIANTLFDLKFFPNNEGYWTRTDSGPIHANKKYWSSGALAAIAQKKMALKEGAPLSHVTISTETSEDGVMQTFVNEGLPTQALRKVLGPQSDAISVVSSAFVTLGIRLVEKSEVLSQSPHPKVRLTLTQSDGELIGFAENTNKKLAKVQLFEKLKTIIKDEEV